MIQNDPTMAVRESGAAEIQLATDWQVGSVLLDLYEITRLLGEGGLGKVYQVRHREWNLDMAVKTPHPHVMDSEAAHIAFDEANTWIDLGLHPHIVSCYYVRTLDGIPRIFAEFVEGGSLSDWISQGHLYREGPQLALLRILDLAIQFAWGLQYTHERGLVHTDVKPANVMVTKDGQLKVTDFGLSRRIADQAPATICTPGYCSPEHVSGLPLVYGSDVWSYGLSVLEMFTGIAPHYGPGAESSLQEYLSRPPVNGVIPSMPEPVGEMLARCFAWEATERPDFASVAALLIQCYEGLVGIRYPRPAPEPIKQLADDLNNKGISLLDLGRRPEAVALLDRAVQEDPQHLLACYNRALVQWRQGAVSDIELVSRLKEVQLPRQERWRLHYLLGCLHLERGDNATGQAELSAASRLVREDSAANAIVGLARSSTRGEDRVALTLDAARSHLTGGAMTPDGRFAVAGTEDRHAHVWNLKEQRLIHTLKGHRDVVTAVAITPDGSRVATASADKTARLWDVSNGHCLAVLQGHTGEVLSVAMTANAALLVTAGSEGALRFWSAHGQCLRVQPAHSGRARAVAMSANGKVAVSAGDDGKVAVWDVESGSLRSVLQGHERGVRSVALTPDGGIALSGADDGTILMWDVPDGKMLRPLKGHQGPVAAICLTPDGRLAASVGQEAAAGRSGSEGTLRLWEVASGRCRRTLGENTGLPTGVSISADGHQVLEISADNALRVWAPLWDSPKSPPMVVRPWDTFDLLANQRIYLEGLYTSQEALNSSDYVAALEAVRPIRSLVGFERMPEGQQMWAWLGRFARRLHLQTAWIAFALEGHNGPVTAAAMTPGGEEAVTGGRDGTLHFWNLQTGKCFRVLPAHAEQVGAVALSADGRLALSAAGLDPAVAVWDVESGQRIGTLQSTDRKIEGLALAPPGHLAVVSSADGHLRLWHPATGKCLEEIDGLGDSVAVTPDGGLCLLATKSGLVRLYDLASGRFLHAVGKHREPVEGVAVTPSGHVLVTASEDMTAEAWDLVSGKMTHKLQKQHFKPLRSVAVTDDGRHVLTGGRDAHLVAWNLCCDREPMAIVGHTGAVNAICLSRDARLCLTACSDGAVRLWYLDWELEDPAPSPWDEAARPCIESFLARRFGQLQKLDLLNHPNPLDRFPWTAEDHEELMSDLAAWGYGWLPPESVAARLVACSGLWTGPPPLAPPPGI